MATRIGVIGVGRIGYSHARIITHHIPDAQLVAIADVSQARAKQVADLLGVQECYDNYQDLLALPHLDGIIIATPSNTHATIVLDAVRMGIPIFCEKPLSLTLEETDAVLAAIAQANVPLQIGFHYRYHPAYRQGQVLIAAGEVGTPLVLKATQRDQSIPSPEFCNPQASGGLIIDMGVHEFDLAQWLLQDEITEVYTLAPPPSEPTILPVGDLDRVLVSIRFRSGAVGNVELARNSRYPDESRHEILGSEGTLLFGQPPQTQMFLASRQYMKGDRYEEHIKSPLEAHYRELAAFVEMVHTGMPPLADGVCSRSALKVALAAYKSLQSGVPVTL